MTSKSKNYSIGGEVIPVATSIPLGVSPSIEFDIPRGRLYRFIGDNAPTENKVISCVGEMNCVNLIEVDKNASYTFQLDSSIVNASDINPQIVDGLKNFISITRIGDSYIANYLGNTSIPDNLAWTTFNGTSNFVSFGDILDTLFAAVDTYFKLKIKVKNVGSGARRLIPKYDSTTGAGFHFYLNASQQPTFAFQTDSTNRRIVSSDTAISSVAGVVSELEIEYNGALDTNDGLDRVVFKINGTTTGKSMAVTGGTLPASIPNVADYLGFATIVDEAGVGETTAMFAGEATEMIIESSGGTVELQIADLSTGTDGSGNGRNGTFV